MKTQENLKKVIVNVTVMLAVVLAIPSCDNAGRDGSNQQGTNANDNARIEDPKDRAEEQNDENMEGRKAEKDAQFLVEAAEINLEEIHLGQLAQTKSTDGQVKKLGKMMENDHTRSLNELKALASKKGIAIPTTLTEDGKDAYNKLNDRKEDKFNEDYCDMMVKGHKDAIDKFEKASENAEDADIKAWAISSLPKLRAHLDHLNTCDPDDRNNKKSASVK